MFNDPVILGQTVGTTVLIVMACFLYWSIKDD